MAKPSPPPGGVPQDIYGRWVNPVQPASGLMPSGTGEGVVSIRPTAKVAVSDAFGTNVSGHDAMLKETEKIMGDTLVAMQSVAQYMRDAAKSAAEAAQMWAHLKSGREDFGIVGGRSGFAMRARSVPEGVVGARATQWYTSAGEAMHESPGGLLRRIASAGARKISEYAPGANAPEVTIAGGGSIDLSTGRAPSEGARVAEAGGGAMREIGMNMLGNALSRGIESGNVLGELGKLGTGRGMATQLGLPGMGGAGLAGAVGTAARFALPAVAVGAAVEQGYERFRGQLAANMPYTQITGDTSRTLGMFNPERLGSIGFQAEQFLNPMGLGSADASRLYMGVLQAGYRGQGEGRGLAMDFGVNMYQRYGMNVQQSLQIITEAFRAGHSELLGVADALDKVAKSAKESKVAVGESQQMFAQNYGTVNQMLGSSQTAQLNPFAPALAGAFTQFQNQLPPSMRQYNIAQALAQNPQAQWQLARQAGYVSPEQMYATLGATPEGQVQLAGQVGNYYENWVARALSGTPIMQELMQRTNNGQNPMNAADLQQFVREAAQRYPNAGIQVMGVLRQLGINVSEADALEYGLRLTGLPGSLRGAVQEQVGQTGRQVDMRGMSPTQRAAEFSRIQKRFGEQPIHRLTRSEFRKVRSGEAVAGVSVDVGYAKTHTYQQAQAKQLQYDLGMNEGSVFGQTSGQRMSNIERIYFKKIQDTGIESGIVEDLIALGKDDLELQVDIGNGKKARVSLGVAIRDFYDQLVDGSAVMVNGDKPGRTVAEATGVPGQDTSTLGIKTGSKQRSQGFTSAKEAGGGTVERWTGSDQHRMQTAASKAGSSGGVLKVSPTPELARILNFQYYPDSSLAGQTTGNTPAPYVPPAARTGGK